MTMPGLWSSAIPAHRQQYRFDKSEKRFLSVSLWQYVLLSPSSFLLHPPSSFFLCLLSFLCFLCAMIASLLCVSQNSVPHHNFISWAISDSYRSSHILLICYALLSSHHVSSQLCSPPVISPYPHDTFLHSTRFPSRNLSLSPLHIPSLYSFLSSLDLSISPLYSTPLFNSLSKSMLCDSFSTVQA